MMRRALDFSEINAVALPALPALCARCAMPRQLLRGVAS
jgi:hypothetical protein